MHDTAMIYGECFFKTYLKETRDLIIVDIGSQDVNGSLKTVAPKDCKYIGMDFVKAKGVDIILKDPYNLPLENESVDVVVSSSCFEHSEFFWLLFNEMLRVIKSSGLIYINAPSNGAFHRYPVDCWRFYPDSGVALQNWGNRSGYDCAMLESFIGVRKKYKWNDFVAVFVKNKVNQLKYPNRIQDNIKQFMNGRLLNHKNIINHIQFFPPLIFDVKYAILFFKIKSGIIIKIKNIIKFMIKKILGKGCYNYIKTRLLNNK